MYLNIRKNKLIQPSSSEKPHPVTDPFGKTIEETGDKLITIPNLNTLIINKIW